MFHCTHCDKLVYKLTDGACDKCYKEMQSEDAQFIITPKGVISAVLQKELQVGFEKSIEIADTICIALQETGIEIAGKNFEPMILLRGNGLTFVGGEEMKND